MLKIIHAKNFRVDKFSRFCSILEIFLHKMSYLRVKVLAVGLNHKIILTVKFTVH